MLNILYIKEGVFMNKFFELLKYLMLAVIQGVGEVFPISSSGHLILFGKLFDVDGEGVGIELILHLASLLALLIYYRKTIMLLIRGNYEYIFNKNKDKSNEYKFVKGMIISLFPTCIVGCFVNDYLETFIKYPILIGVFLLLNAFNLFLIRNKGGEKGADELSFWSFVKIGMGQCMGLVPGFSRSGSALSMCYREKMNKEDSERFTFFMLFPLVLGSVLLNLGDFSFSKEGWILVCISFVVCFACTLFSIGVLGKIIKGNKLHYFAYYSFVIGVIVMFIG